MGSCRQTVFDDDYFYKKDNGKLGMIRCPKCGKENYALMVSTGICAWCGYDVNEEKKDDNS